MTAWSFRAKDSITDITDPDIDGTVTLAVNSPAGITPSAVNFVNGVAVPDPTIFLIAAGEVTITASYAPLSLSNAAGYVSVSASAPDHLIVLRQSEEICEYNTPGIAPGYYTPQLSGAQLTAGIALAVSLAAVDQYYNPILGVSCSFNVQNYGLNVNCDVNTATGYATFLWTPNPTSEGQYIFSVTPNSPFNGLLASADNLKNYITIPSTFYSWVDAPSAVWAGVPFPITVTASSSQYYRNPASGAAGYFLRLDPILSALGALPGNAALEPNVCTISPNGTYVGMVTYTKAETIYLNPVKLSGDKALTFAFSQLIQVQPGMPASLEVSASPNTIEARHESVLTATVRDAYQNRVPNVPISFTKIAGSADAYVSPATVQTNTQGVAQATFTGGIINETATVKVKSNELEKLVNINISVAAISGNTIVNYPNPFDPLKQKTSVNYFLKGDSELEIRVYDAFGRMVFSRNLKAGEGTGDYAYATRAGGASFQWDGKNGEGLTVANGIYVVKLTARNSSAVQTFTRRVGVLK